MSIFTALEIYHDIDSRSAALNMAIDEVLFETAAIPSIRFYKWDHPALSFGYSGKFGDVANRATERDIVRRWTGGGIVLHGEDLTYSIAIPASDPAFGESSMSIYENVHAAIRAALVMAGKNAQLAEEAGPKTSESCFANAVRSDVLWNGRKIAGAAQRRTRRGLLQQGSIQDVDVNSEFADQFASHLCSKCFHKTLDQTLIARAQEIAEQKYSSMSWLQKR